MRSEIDALSAREAETITEHAKEIAKHFGIYKQRERNESGKKDGDFIFMVRVKNPAGGELTPAQWLALDAVADRYADGSLRLTARQGVQFHYVRGHNLRSIIRAINATVSDNGYQLTTLGACGDVNRNTVASPIDDLDAELPLDSHELAHAVAREMAPRSSAYYQVFLADQNGRQVAPLNSDEPVYGAQYLPRKFKVGFAHPHDNSVDLLTQDVGFLPRVNGGAVTGYDLYSGGGMGATHNQAATMPLLALYLGVVQRAQVLETVRAIATMQREHGERRNRRAARWKYTIRRIGVDAVKATLRERFGIALARSRSGRAASGARSPGMASGSARRRLSLRRNPDSQRTRARRGDDQISQRRSAHRGGSRGNRRAHHAQSASAVDARSSIATRVGRADARRTRRALRWRHTCDSAACDGVSGQADLRSCDDACGARAAALSRGAGA